MCYVVTFLGHFNLCKPFFHPKILVTCFRCMYYRAVGSLKYSGGANSNRRPINGTDFASISSKIWWGNHPPPPLLFDGPVLVFQLPAGNFGCISQLRLNFFYHINYQILILFWCHTMMHSLKKSLCRSISLFMHQVINYNLCCGMKRNWKQRC